MNLPIMQRASLALVMATFITMLISHKSHAFINPCVGWMIWDVFFS